MFMSIEITAALDQAQPTEMAMTFVAFQSKTSVKVCKCCRASRALEHENLLLDQLHEFLNQIMWPFLSCGNGILTNASLTTAINFESTIIVPGDFQERQDVLTPLAIDLTRTAHLSLRVVWNSTVVWEDLPAHVFWEASITYEMRVVVTAANTLMLPVTLTANQA